MDKLYEIIKYIIFGILTTLVNYVAYFMTTRIWNINYLISNMIAWAISVLFAYTVNKIFVFHSLDKSIKRLFKEFTAFISARVISGLLETIILFIFVTMFNFDDKIIKVAASIIVVVLNYFFSKYFIFKKS